jgi:hypothetical protein
MKRFIFGILIALMIMSCAESGDDNLLISQQSQGQKYMFVSPTSDRETDSLLQTYQWETDIYIYAGTGETKQQGKYIYHFLSEDSVRYYHRTIAFDNMYAYEVRNDSLFITDDSVGVYVKYKIKSITNQYLYLETISSDWVRFRAF